jgi:hypothetical protein
MRNSRTKLKIVLWVFLLTLGTILLLNLESAYGAKVCIGGSGGLGVAPLCGDKKTAADYKAKIVKGRAIPPKYAPKKVKKVIRAGNRIRNKPYVYGGGHGPFRSEGYDCSGAVSFALKGGKFVKTPLSSTPFMSWGKKGKGEWITVYTHSGHAYLEVAGIRFDTSGTGGAGPRWHKAAGDKSGFVARHPAGY